MRACDSFSCTIEEGIKVQIQACQLLSETKLKSAHVSSEYLALNWDGRENMFRQDILSLYEKHRDGDLKVYIDEALEIVMKISLEEASHTVHMPAVFNQEVDGASEKYIETKDSRFWRL